MQTGRFQPYGTSRARTIEYGNAGAGPSTLVPPLVPYIGPPMPQPSGGISETPANAEQTQTNTEEDKVPVSSFYCSHIPHVIEWSFGVRQPNGPGAPVAKENPVATADDRREMPTNYVNGYRGE